MRHWGKAYCFRMSCDPDHVFIDKFMQWFTLYVWNWLNWTIICNPNQDKYGIIDYYGIWKLWILVQSLDLKILCWCMWKNLSSNWNLFAKCLFNFLLLHREIKSMQQIFSSAYELMFSAQLHGIIESFEFALFKISNWCSMPMLFRIFACYLLVVWSLAITLYMVIHYDIFAG